MKKFVLALFVLSLVSFNVYPVDGDKNVVSPQDQKSPCPYTAQWTRPSEPKEARYYEPPVEKKSESKEPAKIKKI